MSGNPGTEQKAASGFLGLLVVAFFIVAQAGAYFIHPALKLFSDDSFLLFDGLALALVIVGSIVNFKNTFETNDNWKTYLGVAAIIYTVVMTALFIGKGA